ncbi:hypothetical protein AB1Y20_006741 [Prymnesium parvum]|uniref:EF-hand domain-containing protein n=1 Tax=Prymnesium parvum TaxID=97485 RepID=A0AB34J189_PRYPA
MLLGALLSSVPSWAPPARGAVTLDATHWPASGVVTWSRRTVVLASQQAAVIREMKQLQEVTQTDPPAMPSVPCALNQQLKRAKTTEDVLQLTSELVLDLVDMDPRHSTNIATALHQLAAMNKRRRAARDAVLRDPRFTLLVEATAKHAPDLTARDTADVLWSFATMQHLPPALLKPLLLRVSEQLDGDGFEGPHLSTTVWSLARLECKPTRLLARIEQQAIPKLIQMNTQNLANLLWGFAKLGYAPSTLLPELSAALCAPGALHSIKPVEVADLCFALGILGGKAGEHHQLMLALAANTTLDNNLERFTSRQVVILIWAIAKQGMASNLPEGLLEKWVKYVRVRHEATPLLAQDARNLERALRALGLDASWVSRSAMLNSWQDAASGSQAQSVRIYTEEELRATFDAIDTDNSGDIDLKELTIAIKQIRSDADEMTIKAMLNLADEDGNSEVSYEEFKKIMLSK